jgi:hypothetical protein
VSLGILVVNVGLGRLSEVALINDRNEIGGVKQSTD